MPLDHRRSNIRAGRQSPTLLKLFRTIQHAQRVGRHQWRGCRGTGVGQNRVVDAQQAEAAADYQSTNQNTFRFQHLVEELKYVASQGHIHGPVLLILYKLYSKYNAYEMVPQMNRY